MCEFGGGNPSRGIAERPRRFAAFLLGSCKALHPLRAGWHPCMEETPPLCILALGGGGCQTACILAKGEFSTALHPWFAGVSPIPLHLCMWGVGACRFASLHWEGVVQAALHLYMAGGGPSSLCTDSSRSGGGSSTVLHHCMEGSQAALHLLIGRGGIPKTLSTFASVLWASLHGGGHCFADVWGGPSSFTILQGVCVWGGQASLHTHMVWGVLSLCIPAWSGGYLAASHSCTGGWASLYTLASWGGRILCCFSFLDHCGG